MRLRGRFGAWGGGGGGQGLDHILGRRDGQHHRRRAGRVLVDQKNLNGSCRALQADLVLLLAVDGLFTQGTREYETVFGYNRHRLKGISGCVCVCV